MNKPFEPATDYTKVHNALFNLYTRLDDFKSDHALMYTVLMSYYNVEYGYAFPTKAELALRLNVGINKPRQLAKVLEKYRLIKCVPRDRSKVGSNDIYYVYAPITSEAEFYEAFPFAKERYEERKHTLMERNKVAVGGDIKRQESINDDEFTDWL